MYKQNNYKRTALKTISNNKLKTMSEPLPSYVHRYRRSISESVPKVVATRDKMKSIEERKLRRFFKCTMFNLKSNNRSDQCFVCKNNKTVFDDHVNIKHPKQSFYCCYCYPKLNDSEYKDKNYMDGEKLVKHLLGAHLHRRYQCNLCLYRAISAEHVDIHQKLIHSAIHKSTLQHKELNGKLCKILECPPPTATSARKPLPKDIDIFWSHKSIRLNNDENHNKDYQCVYCPYMNETISGVVEHCVQTHPDYHILYYVPEPLVTSTHSPKRVQQYSEIDLFNNVDIETQDNSVTSTDCEAIKNWEIQKKKSSKEVEELSFKKKARISTVQTVRPKTGLSAKRANNYSYPSAANSRGAGPRPVYHKLGAPVATRRPMHCTKKAMPKSVKENFVKLNAIYRSQNDYLRKKQYESDDSSDEPTPPKAAKIVDRPVPTSLPPLLTPQKIINRRMICKICDGNHREFAESQMTAHIEMYHKTKPGISGRNVPFMCGYCKDFFDDQTDSGVKAHQLRCKSRGENDRIFADRMIVSKDEYQRSRPKSDDKNSSDSNQKSNDRSNESDKRSNRPRTKTKRKLNLLSDDELDEICSSSSSSAPVLLKQSSVRSNSSERSESRREINLRPKTTKNSVHRRPKAIRTESHPNKDYESSDSISSVAETDNENEFIDPQPSTSRMTTTTIERADPESDEEICEYVCLFCEDTFAIAEDAINHLESHIPDLSEAMNDYKVTKPVSTWSNAFIKSQLSLFQDDRAADDSEYPYKCPICDKIARIKRLRPKRFRTFWELRSHVWEHSAWKPVKCLLCTGPDHLLPNCDYIIAKHLNGKHSEDISESDDSHINRLLGNKAKNNFTDEQRLALETNQFLETHRYEHIDGKIEAILKDIIDDREAQLRARLTKSRRSLVTLPAVQLERLPPLNFDDEDMVIDFIDDNEKQIRRKRIVETIAKLEPKKPLDVLDIGSSSSSDDEQPTVIIRKKASPVDKDKHQINETTDDEIEVVREINSSFTNSDDSTQQSIAKEPTPSLSDSDGAPALPLPEVSTSPDDSPVKRYKCALCQQLFENKKQMKTHGNEAHVGQPTLFSRI